MVRTHKSSAKMDCTEFLGPMDPKTGSRIVYPMKCGATDPPLPGIRLVSRSTVRLDRVGLSDEQRGEIISQVSASSPDSPEDWNSELRVRRVIVAGHPYLLVRGSRFLCGATGNCQTWLFRWIKGKWLSVIRGEPPLVSDLRWRWLRGGVVELTGCNVFSAQYRDCTNWNLTGVKFTRIIPDRH